MLSGFHYQKKNHHGTYSYNRIAVVNVSQPISSDKLTVKLFTVSFEEMDLLSLHKIKRKPCQGWAITDLYRPRLHTVSNRFSQLLNDDLSTSLISPQYALKLPLMQIFYKVPILSHSLNSYRKINFSKFYLSINYLIFHNLNILHWWA